LISSEQQKLLDASKETLRLQEADGCRAPCFGLYIDADGSVREESRECSPGREEELFGWVVAQLGRAVEQGAIATALVVPLERGAGDTQGGVMVDLQERGARLVGVVPWALKEGALGFGEATFTQKPPVLFGAA
jgi:hypothetical protein